MPAVLVGVFTTLGVNIVTAAILAEVVVVAATAFTAISFLSKALSGRGGARSEATERAIKNPTPARQYVHGIRRLHGTWMLFGRCDTAGLTLPNSKPSKGATVDVFAFCEGPVQVKKIYLNDDVVTLGTGGVVNKLPDGTYKLNTVYAGYNTGQATETAHTMPQTLLPGVWTSAHRGDGIVSGYLVKTPVEAGDYIAIYPQGDNVDMSLVVESGYAYDPREVSHDPYNDSTWALTENAALLLLRYYMVYRGYDYNARILPNEAYWIAAADDCDLPVDLDSVRVLMTADANIGATSITVDNVSGLSAGMSVLIYSIEDSTKTETRTVSSVAGSTINIPALTYAHKAGSAVAWASDPLNPVSEPKYRAAIAWSGNIKPGDIITEHLACFDGWVAHDENGCLKVYSGKLYTPSVSIGPDQIVSYNHQSWVEEEDAVNILNVKYVSSQHDYEMVECEPWTDDDDITARGELPDGLDVQVPSHTQARRLAKRVMARRNATSRGRVTTNVAGRAVIGERYINLRIEEAGAVFFDGVAEIINPPERDYDTGGCTFDWVAVNANIDAWNPATEDGEPAPIGNRVAPSAVATPVISATSAELDAGGTSARILITVTAEDRPDLTWYGRWKVSTDSIWNESIYSDIDAGSSIQLLTPLVPLNASIDVAVAYKGGDGRLSDWSTTSTVSTTTANLAPSPNTAFTATGGVGQIIGSFANSTSSNFGHSELWHNTTSSFTGATQLGADFTGGAGVTQTFARTKTAGTYYVWTLAFNAADTANRRVGPIQVTVT